MYEDSTTVFDFALNCSNLQTSQITHSSYWILESQFWEVRAEEGTRDIPQIVWRGTACPKSKNARGRHNFFHTCSSYLLKIEKNLQHSLNKFYGYTPAWPDKKVHRQNVADEIVHKNANNFQTYISRPFNFLAKIAIL